MKRDVARTVVPTWSCDLELKRLISSSNSTLSSKQGKLILVEGNIAAGKSILSKRLGEHFNFVVRLWLIKLFIRPSLAFHIFRCGHVFGGIWLTELNVSANSNYEQLQHIG